MVANNLLESYVHVINENKKIKSKNILQKYFSTDPNFQISKILIFRKFVDFHFFENFEYRKNEKSNFFIFEYIHSF